MQQLQDITTLGRLRKAIANYRAIVFFMLFYEGRYGGLLPGTVGGQANPGTFIPCHTTP